MEKTTLTELRHSIDNIDNAIVAMLAERFKITDKVGKLKAIENLPVQDKEREQAQYQRMEILAEQYALDPEFAKAFLSVVISKVLSNHKDIAQKMHQDET